MPRDLNHRQVDAFRRIADVLRSTQRVAIEVENAPDQRKRLRSFSAPEVAALLGVTQKQLRVGDKTSPAPTRMGFTEVQALRAALQGKVAGIAPVPHRHPGEALATIDQLQGRRWLKPPAACTLPNTWHSPATAYCWSTSIARAAPPHSSALTPPPRSGATTASPHGPQRGKPARQFGESASASRPTGPL